MATKTYHGSCHCKRVRFEADIDLEKGTGKCNCSYCWKVRNWSVHLKPAQFRVVAGEAEIGDYGFRPESTNFHSFCRHCGVRLFTHGDIPQLGGAYVSVMLPAIDDLPAEELAGAPVRYMNGREDDWFHEPRERRHL
jgi:hypothetical protein